MILSLTHIAKSFGPTLVLSDVSLVVNDGDRLALVGPNGAGKSTLLKIIAGCLTPDSGEVVIPRPLDLGYLAQSVEAPPGQSVDALLRQSHARLHRIGERLRALEALLAGAGESSDRTPAERDGETLLLEHADLTDEYARLGGYDLEHRTEEVFAGLGIAHLDRAREVATLSGGEKARVALASLLLRDPDLLLLDEPTNHLDFAALSWLETFLRRRKRGFIVVSHDRRFLNRTVTAIVELDDFLKDARVFPGDYDAYAAAKAAELAQWREAYEREQAEIKALRAAISGAARRVGHTNRPPPDNDKFAKTFFGENQDRAISRNVRAAQEKLRRIEADPLLRPPDPLRLHAGLDPEALAGHTPLLAHDLRKSFGDRSVLDGVTLELRRDSRIVITGPNGAGKTTLLRILAGLDAPDGGTVTKAPAARIGYLDQEQEGLDTSLTVFDAYRRGLTEGLDALRSSLFRHGFFQHADVQKRVGQLSLGQRRKLQLARLAAQRANVLLLDEPTNHLDLPTLEAFETALADFPGPVLAVSHDRWFIARFAKAVYELRRGRLFLRPHTEPDRVVGHPQEAELPSERE